jgi:hypothetical protein
LPPALDSAFMVSLIAATGVVNASGGVRRHAGVTNLTEKTADFA